MATQVLDSTDLEGILTDAGNTLGEVIYEVPKTDDGKDGVKKAEEAIKPESKAMEETHKDDEEDENGLTEEQKKDLSSKMQKAIGKKHRMLKEAEEFAAAQYNERKLAEQRAANLERELESLRVKPETKQEAPKKPQRSDFSTDNEFLDASIAFGVQEGLRLQREQQAKEAAEREAKTVMEQASERLEKAKELVEDFDEVVSNADVVIPRAIAGYMQKSDMFAELGYHFAKNPDLILSLSKLSPDMQLVKVGRIEGTLEPFDKVSKKAEVKDVQASGNNGSKPSKNETEDILPRQTRKAPVISPLNSGSANVEIDPLKIRDVIVDYQKKNGINFSRKRH